MVDRKAFEAALEKVPHDLNTAPHAPILEGLIKWLKPVQAVEIGTSFGYLTCVMARALQELGGERVLYAVDNFSGGCGVTFARDDLESNLKSTGCESAVKVFAVDSKAVIYPEGIGLAMVDGDHTVEGAIQDVTALIAAHVPVICLHDTHNRDWPGPALALGYLAAAGYQVASSPHSCGFAMALRL